MNRFYAPTILAALILMLASATAWARNPHCAGGIQYLNQANLDKVKGNIDDYNREIQKAVQQFEACLQEDPSDFEAIAKLGWAYCLVDSFRPAGKVFGLAIEGLTAKGDKAKLDAAVTNRKAFWAEQFNKGILGINTGQQLYNPYAKTPANDEEKKAKESTKKNYDEAIVSLNKALYLIPNDAQTLKNLGNVHMLMADYVEAERFFAEAQKADPKDTSLAGIVKMSRAGRADQFLTEKKYDEAMQYYEGLLKDDPDNGDLWSGLGDAALSKAQQADSSAKKALFCKAAEAFAKAATMKPGVLELPFNAAVCYQNCGNLAAAEAQWKAALAVKKDDREALINLASVLADQKKYPDAINNAMRAIALDPKDMTGFQHLGNVYSRAGDKSHSQQFALGFLALRSGKAATAPAAASGAAGTKLQSSMGKPDQIMLWEADHQAYESWFYWSKGQAFHFTGGAQVEKTDWSAALAAK